MRVWLSAWCFPTLPSRSPTPAIDEGAPIPGFNGGYRSATPDIGAFENGNPTPRCSAKGEPGT